MKKYFSIFLVLTLMLSLLPQTAAAAGTTVVPQHIALDFEDGWDSSMGTVTPSSTATWTNSNTCCESAGSLEFSTTMDYGTISFPFRAVPGNTYDISLWVRLNEAPKTQDASFVIYTKTASGSSAYNQITASHTEDFEAGKWVKLTATYAPNGKGYAGGSLVDVLTDGTIELRLGNGVISNVVSSSTLSYGMDNFFIVPYVNNQIATNDFIPNGSFDTEWSTGDEGTDFKGVTGWENSTKAVVTWINGGANGTTGAVDVNITEEWYDINVAETIPLQFFKEYEVTFWAKALNQTAKGLKLYPYLTFPSKTDKDVKTVNLNNHYVGNQTLSEEWQKFTIRFSIDQVVSDNCEAKLFMRAGNGTELANYALDEVSMKQIGSANFEVPANAYGALGYQDGVTIQMDYQQTKGQVVYRVVKETYNGDECIASGTTTLSSIWIPSNANYNNETVRVDLFGIDSYQNYSQVNSLYLNGLNDYQDTVKLTVDQYIWTNDLTALSATATYESLTSTKTLMTITALYSKDDELLAINTAQQTVAPGTKLSWQTSVNTVPDAVKAKFFAWFESGNAPAISHCELTKTKDGAFIYVDSNSAAPSEDGSFNAPYKTIGKAKTAVKQTLANTNATDVYVILKSGEYIPDNYETLLFANGDYAQDKNVTYTSLSGEKAKISGALHVSGSAFEPYGNNGIYRASVPAGTNARQLYVNGIKATRARSAENAITLDNLDRATKSKGTKYENFTSQGIKVDDAFINYQYPNELEVVFNAQWKHRMLRVDTITNSSNGTVLNFTEEGNKKNWYDILTDASAPVLDDPIYVENALELLDEAGEWYLDTHENLVYYKPRAFETIGTIDVVIPNMEKLVELRGTYDNPVRNIGFKNIDFEYTTWNYPTANRFSLNGQNATYERPDGGTLMDGAVEFLNVNNITVDNCDFSKIGSLALKMFGGVQNCEVVGNEFYDIAGSALALGEVEASGDYANWDPRHPENEGQHVTDNVIANNYIHKIATEYRSAAALSAGYPKNTVIRNNELCDGSYTGIHIGWGWNQYQTKSPIANLVVEKNYVHDFLNWRIYDGAGIYTLGVSGGNKENPNMISRNYIKDIKNDYAAIYTDNGSKGWKVSENVVDMSEYPLIYRNFVEYTLPSSPVTPRWYFAQDDNLENIIENNYSTTDKTTTYATTSDKIDYEAPYVYPDANWDSDALQIIKESGIEKKYQSRFDFGVQTLRTPLRYNMKDGETQSLYYTAETTKDKLVDFSDYVVIAKSSNPAIATATGTTLKGVKEGMAWITLTYYKNVGGKIEDYGEHTFYVVVD